MSSEKLQRYDTVRWGLLAGFLGAILSFFLLYGITLLRGQTHDVSHFFNQIFLNTQVYTSGILSFCLVLDVPLFFIALKWDLEKFAKGVLSVFFIFLPFIIYFRFF